MNPLLFWTHLMIVLLAVIACTLWYILFTIGY
jgi:hypothetical protein